MYLTITTSAQGEFHLQDPFPAEGYCVKRIAPSTTVTYEVTVIQLNHLKTQLDAAVKAGIVSSYTFDDADQVPSDELLELRNRTAKIATLAVTGGAVPNLVTLGVRKGDIFNMYVKATGVTLSYEVDEVNSATCFTATTVVVAFDKIAAGDKIYFSRDGVLITGTDRTVAGAITHVIATVSQSPYQRTGFGRFFVKASDGKPYFLTSAGVELNLGMTGSDPLIFKGAISIATDFPLIAAVKTGWLYRVLADVKDNGGATYTNTQQAFLAGAEIAWNGTNWTELGTSSAVQEVHTAGAFTLPAGSSTTFVDTTTAGAGTSCTLPAASATKLGETIAVGDYTGAAATNPITIGRTGGDTIDGVAANLVINKNNVFVSLECVSATGWKTVNRIAPVSSAATPAAVGSAAAGTSKVCSPDDHVHGHGNLAGGSFHAAAVAATSDGFMTGADKSALDTVVGDAVRDGDFTANGRMIRTGAATYGTIHDSLANTIAPTVNNDASGGAGGKETGFSVGSIWIDTTADRAYICLDATNTLAVWHPIESFSHFDSRQGAAITETLRFFRALKAGRIVAASAETGTVAAAGESMTLDVQINAATCLTGVITVDSTTVIDTPVAGVIDATKNTYAAGDLIRVVRTYAPGGGATPMKDTVCDIETMAL